ncbi:hypothetical protein F0335_09850 [Serratia marcescens]|uniref:hypothetical protein n=1 Tax=Serratia marcescens TaxID=615 RepID=UPI0011F2BF7E|nr:hypothetical protein [Serratia marcescens]QKO38821.1 hypothetical protein F0335_09850 [Serratia marcescens]
MEDHINSRLNNIHASLQQIADITLKIAMSSASDADKQKQIAPQMRRHAELIEEAQKLLK